ncbi:MAG: hypothetical protein WDM77_00530, partial [Steroidobacteraceae bacterium]
MQGATIDAPSGALNVVAASDPLSPVSQSAQGSNPLARIRIDAGTTIDLSGSDALLPISANLVTLQLRSNELADDPSQRNGALRGDTVTIDVRADGGLGTPIANVSSAIAAVGSTIAQRTEAGGQVNFQSEGDVVFAPSASINVSGGHTTYQGGTIQTTQLVGANGQLYDIGTANPLMTYTAVENPTFSQSFNVWGIKQVVPTPGLGHFEAGYVQGASAGAVHFTAQSMVLDGTLEAQTVSGPYQRGPIPTGNSTPAFGDAPAGGALTIGTVGVDHVLSSGQSVYDFFSPGVTVTENPAPIVVSDSAPLPIQSLQLPAVDLTSDGFTTIQIYSNTAVTLPAHVPLQLAPGASLTVEAPRIDLDSSISAPAGSLNFQNVLTVASGGPRPGIDLGNGVSLNVGGQWTNDAILASGIGTAPTLQNAGSINLQLAAAGSELVLGNNVALTADGGAWVQPGGAVAYGGGRLDHPRCESGAGGDCRSVPAVRSEAFGTGTAKGGSFSLAAPRLEISQGAGAWTEAQQLDDLGPGLAQVFQIYSPLFSDDGFSSIKLTASGAAGSTRGRGPLPAAWGSAPAAMC